MTVPPQDTESEIATTRPRRRHTPAAGVRIIILGAGLVLLCLAVILSLFLGSGSIAPDRVIDALFGGGATTDDLLIRDFRVPRTILAVLVGLALALSGVVMQALTRNPLADPGILGVNAGAYFAVVVGAAFFGAAIGPAQIAWAVAGAGLAAAVVYAVASTGVAAGTVVKLILSGVAIGAVLSGLSQAITFAEPDVFDRIRFWSIGSLQGRQIDTVAAVWPVIIVGAIIVVFLSRSLNALTMGDDVARALGTNILFVRTTGFVAVTTLCGAATAAAGPLIFVGLVVPFAARFTVGVDHRWIIAFSVVYGPVLVVLADVIGRLLVSSELPVGVVTAFIGAPIMIALVRRTSLRSL